ncbi:MAG: DUF4838 domain-containing protein, partial [Lentisphaeria bacterium]|nr:DUF4838 domain-containing protein [Lentisphaeria bacterium]
KTAAWAHLPQTGTVQENIGSARLEPKTGGWNTVGLRANWIRGQSNSKLLPVRVKLLDFPAGVSRFDAGLVQGFEMEVGDEQIQLRAHTPLGLSNAIYYMLDYWGCRWVMPGKLGECIPKKDSLTLPSGATRFAPRADLAIEVAGRQGNVAEWYRRNLGGWQNWISGQHYWLYALPPKQHFADHPEWYALVAGKRSPKQLCTTNPEVVEQMIVKAKSFLRAAPTRVSFPMDPADNIDFCQCERCRALDPKTTDPGGAVCVTNRVLTFANQVAKGIQDEFPDRYVAFYAYATHANLPDNIRPADNVIIIAARSGHCLLHLTPTPKCPTSDFHAFVKRWRELTPNIYCYEYDPISWTGGLPCPTYLEMARSLQALFLEVGIKGSYSDGLHAQTSASTYINRYMARRMKIDPTQRPEDVLREMCQAFFGPAARPMEQYYLRLARVAEHTHAGRSRVGGGTTFYAGLFDRDMLRDARRHMDQAKTQVNNSDPYRERVEMVGASLRYLEAYTNGTWRAQEHDYQASVAAFDRMDRIIDELDAKGMIYAAEARQRAKTKRLKALAQHFPKKLGFVTKWRLLGPFDNTSCNADRVQDVFEPLASIDGPVTLPDGRRMQWQDYTSPGGFLNLENAFKGQVGDWILSYAYVGTIISPPHLRKVQLKMDSFFPFKVFLNGRQVYYRPGLDADRPDKRVVDVDLLEGDNTLVFKISQTRVTSHSFPWGLYYRMVAEEKRPDVTDFPSKWAFHTDPDNVGTKQAWFAAEFADSAWQRIPVPSAWEKTAAGQYDGYAWYRVKFDVVPEVSGKKLALTFRGVDEQAWIYVNGTYVGERTSKSTGRTVGEYWEEAFELSLPPGCVRPGGDNVLAVRVHDWRYAGGIYGAVRLLLDE